MHKSLNTLRLASAAMALVMTPALAAAQDQATPPVTEQVMPQPAPTDAMPTTTPAEPAAPTPAAPALTTAEVDAKMQAWPAEQRTAFTGWAPEVQSYFWTLNEDRQELFWKIADADKATLATMAEPQREATWVELETRVKAMQG